MDRIQLYLLWAGGCGVGGIYYQYRIEIVQQSGASQINIEGSGA